MNTNQRRVLKELMNLENRTMSQVAKSAGVTRQTVYNYLKDPAVQDRLNEAEGADIAAATARLVTMLESAVTGLGSVLFNPTQEGATAKRLAAKDILEIMLKLRTVYNLEEKITEILRDLES